MVQTFAPIITLKELELGATYSKLCNKEDYFSATLKIQVMKEDTVF